MKLSDFIAKLELAYRVPNYYGTGGWGILNKTTNKWKFDCNCYIKSILWGWNNDYSKPRGGGATYGSNGVPDISCEQMIKVCNKVSTDFKNIDVGELMFMPGHVGIYIGNRQVIECTVAWDTNKIIITNVSNNGKRTYNGKGNKYWKKHGYLPYVNYDNTQIKEWLPGRYKLLYDKAIRKTHEISTNIVNAKNCTKDTKKHLVSLTGKAYLKSGTTITCLNTYNENGRIWGSYGNCWVCICNKDGSAQAEKV